MLRYFFIFWKNNDNKLPLIVKGARLIGKTDAIENFAKSNYSNIVEINFVLDKQYKSIFDNGFDVDGRYDVICSGSLMGINYNEIESNSVGNKQDYEMHSMDFEEFLWAKGYKEEQIDDMYFYMKECTPLPQIMYDVMLDNFNEYMVVGGMPAIVSTFINNKNYSGILQMQKQILLDYRKDITKYAVGLNQARILNIYNKIPVFLGNENKKFQISKVEHGARNREYIGVVDWLNNAGIINIYYCLEQLEPPLK